MPRPEDLQTSSAELQTQSTKICNEDKPSSVMFFFNEYSRAVASTNNDFAHLRSERKCAQMLCSFGYN